MDEGKLKMVSFKLAVPVVEKLRAYCHNNGYVQRRILEAALELFFKGKK